MAAVPALEPKPVANWVTGEYLRLRNAADRPGRACAPAELGAIIAAVEVAGPSRAPRAARCSRRMPPSGEAAAAIIAARGFRQISDSGALAAAVDEVLAANPAAVADYRAGKAQAVGFLVGQVMKATRGQANAALVQAAVRERLDADDQRRAETGGADQHRPVAGRGGPHRRRLHPRPRAVDALPGAQGAGRERRPATSAWRGGIRDDGTTGASVAMAILRRQAQIGAGIAIAGVVLVFLGLPHPLIRADGPAGA